MAKACYYERFRHPKDDNGFTVVDLFAGAGGLSLGFFSKGFRVLQALDHNPSAVSTYRRNLGEHIEQAEIGLETALPPSALIVGGPPCQGFSSAGLRHGNDHRNTLVKVFSRLVSAARPRMFVFENVEGFLTAANGERVHDLLEPLILAGYQIHLRKVNAASFGVPQHRKRVIAIGALGFEPSFPEPTHSAFGAPGANGGHGLPPTPTVEQALRELPPPARNGPGRPQGHAAKALSDERLALAQALGPGKTMQDLPQELWHPSYRRRAYRRVMDGTPTERRGGPPAGIRRLDPEAPSKAITGGASGEFLHPF